MFGSIKKILSHLNSRQFLAFIGSGLIVSVAYIDPGNWGTNITAGANFNYNLLWVVWMASGMAMLFQYLSGKLGIVGVTLPELIRTHLPSRTLRVGYWIMAEVTILATDLAEFLGIVVAMHLLFHIPLVTSAFLSTLDIFFVLFLTEGRFRLLEQAFVLFVSFIGIGYLYELILTRPDSGSVLYRSFVPSLSPQSAMVAVGIVGATVMPHALFVHSWLIKKKLLRLNLTDKTKAMKFHLADNIISLTIAGCINAAMIIMAASAFFRNGEHIATLDAAYLMLLPLFGSFASTIFALALLAAGVSSSITDTLAGQAIMEGLVNIKINVWVRRIITRMINLIPILYVATHTIEPLSILVISQAVLSLLLPFVIIPLVKFTGDKRIMGIYVNRLSTAVLSIALTAIIIGMNIYLVVSMLMSIPI